MSSKAGSAQAKTRNHLVRHAGERAEHPPGVGFVDRLAELLPGAVDDRVDPEHRVAAALDRPRLAGRVLERVSPGLFLEGRSDHLERDAQLRQDRAPLRRGRCEHDHARFRVTQNSSSGQLVAHSTSAIS